MSDVQSWSISRGPLDINELTPRPDGEIELVSLRAIDEGEIKVFGLPARLLVMAKVTYKSTQHGRPPASGEPGEFSMIPTLLYDSYAGRLDDAWCNLFTHDAGATTVCLHATVDAGGPEFFPRAHTLSLRTRPNSFSWEIDDIWLIALSLDSRNHQESRRGF
ncbi:MAG: hypothetical protein WD770_07785 [Actinomycetota bacterium]